MDTITVGRASRAMASFSRISASPRPFSKISPAVRSKAIARRAFQSGPRTTGRSTASPKRDTRYSSSIYPIRHDHYGVPDAARFAHRMANGLIEVPVTYGAPARYQLAGGRGRLFPPLALRRFAMVAPARQRGRSACRRCSISIRGKSIPSNLASTARAPKRRFRHYFNLKRMGARLKQLLTDFRWDRVDHVFLNGAH